MLTRKHTCTSALVALVIIATAYILFGHLSASGVSAMLVKAFIILDIGLVLIVSALVVQWLKIHRSRFQGSVSGLERTATSVLTILTLVFSVQFVATVYAMAWTLSSSTTEVEDTKQIITGDFDGDGDVDYIAFNDWGGGNDGVRLYKNDGSGVFTTPGPLFDTTSMNTMTAFDMDGDGDLDLLGSFTATSSIFKYINDGSGNFTKSTITSSASAMEFAVADFNRDGSLDFVIGYNASAQVFWSNNGHGVFAARNSTIPYDVRHITAGDYNSDGIVDVAIIDQLDTVYILRNSGTGAFVLMGTSLSGLGAQTNRLVTGDVDGDGDLDLLAPAQFGTFGVAFNNGAGTSFPGTGGYGTVADPMDIALGDFDNDGDLDVELAGDDAAVTNAGNELWTNNGSGVFTISGTPTEESDRTMGIGSADIDADGDLDYIAGNYGANRHYKSDQASTSANTAPTAPTSLTATLSGTAGNGSGSVLLTWGSGSDAETATKLLQYQVRVGTGTGLHNIVTGVRNGNVWVSHLMPNGQSRSRLVKYLPCNNTYYWTVSTVDTGYKATAATETTFTLDASCVLTAGGGGSSGSTGGGWSWNTLRQAQRNGGGAGSPALAALRVQAYNDISGDGVRESLESSAEFKDLPVMIEGTTTDGKVLKKIVALNDQGILSVKIKPGTYTVTVDKDSFVVKTKVPTSPVVFKDILLTSGESQSLSVGFHEKYLLRHAPCMGIGKDDNSFVGSDAEQVLRRLTNQYGEKVTKSISLTEPLMTRRTFFRLLAPMHCLELYHGEETLKKMLKQSFDTHTVPSWTSIELRDLPITTATADGRTVYALLAAGIPVVRSSPVGPIADLSSPITRSDAVKIVAAILGIPKNLRATEGNLPTDLLSTDPLLSDLYTLQGFTVTPDSFLPVFGPLHGLTPKDAAILLVRSAFRGGRINLLPDFSLKGAAAPESFLKKELPNFMLPSTVIRDSSRADKVSFKDVLPGDDLYPHLRAALAFGTKNKAGQTLYLVTGTARTTEFGVEKGQITLNLDEPASLLETLRALTVLAGIPPPTHAAVATGADKRDLEGSGEQRVTTDHIGNLERDASMASRFFYRVQDPVRAFNVSLVSYCPWLLKRPNQSPSAALTANEAADFVASALLSIYVRTGEITPQVADTKMQALRESILDHILATTDQSVKSAVASSTIFTRRMLIDLLGTITSDAVNGESKEFTSEMTQGVAWWHRVR